jgi:hypothetical protein
MQPKRRKVSSNFMMDPELLARLDELATRQDRSRSWLIEQAVRQMLDQPAQPSPSTIPYYVPPPTFGPLPKTTSPLIPIVTTELEHIFRDPATADTEEPSLTLERAMRGLPE